MPRKFNSNYRRFSKVNKQKNVTYSISRTIAPAGNNPNAQGAVQALLAAHNPGAAIGWVTLSYEMVSGNGLVAMLANAYTVTPNTQLYGVSIKCMTESSLNCMVAYKETQNAPYRVISGVGRLRSFFKFPKGAVNMMLPDHILLIAEGAMTFKFKFFLARAVIRSVV